MSWSYLFFVTSRISGYTFEFDYQSFIKWYENVWDTNKLMENYWIRGIRNEHHHPGY